MGFSFAAKSGGLQDIACGLCSRVGQTQRLLHGTIRYDMKAREKCRLARIFLIKPAADKPVLITSGCIGRATVICGLK